jgi:hypothetical protein
MGFLVLSLSKWALLTFVMYFCRLSNCHVVLRALIGVLLEGAEDFGTGTSRREFWRNFSWLLLDRLAMFLIHLSQ